jgi:hypothetical protein
MGGPRQLNAPRGGITALRDSETLSNERILKALPQARVNESEAIPRDERSELGDLVEQQIDGILVLLDHRGQAQESDESREVAKGVGGRLPFLPDFPGGITENRLEAGQRVEGGEAAP